MVRPAVVSFPLYSSSLAIFFFIRWLEFRNEISLKPRSALCRVGCAEVLDQWNQSSELQSAWEAAEEGLDSRVSPPLSRPPYPPIPESSLRATWTTSTAITRNIVRELCIRNIFVLPLQCLLTNRVFARSLYLAVRLVFIIGSNFSLNVTLG